MTSFAEITGLVDRAQNPDALLTDGARALTGNLSVADGITIDGVDISAFQSAYQAHLANPVAHSYVRNILDDASAAVDRGVLTNDVRIYGADGISVTKTSTGLRISGSGGGGGGSTFAGIKDPSGAAAVPDGFNYISLTASNQVSITASTNALAFALVPGNINHQDLGGRGADDHHAGFVGLKVGATTVNPDGSDVITIAAGTNATVVAGSNKVTIGVSSTPAFTSVTVSGNISVSGTVDGVDISTHAANANAHHNQQHALAGGDHTASGLTAGQVLRASGATTFAWAQLAHGDLSSIGTNTHAQIDTHIATGDTHVAHSAVSITAGAGLTGGGTIAASRTINVGAGAGITVNADDVALTTPGSLSATSTNSSSGSHTHAIDSTIARSAIQINSGNGLTGGGDLTANRTLNVGAGNGISVAADSVAVNQAYAFSWTGLHTFGEHTEMESVDVNGALTVTDNLTVFYGGFSPLFVNVDTVNPNNSNVGIMPQNLPGGVPDPQFALDVGGPLRAQYLIGPHAIQLSDAAMIAHFDGPYPFETNFDGSAVGHLGQVPTVTGGAIYRPGKFGKGAQLAEATTNLITNPSFEINLSGWSTSGGERWTHGGKYGDCHLAAGGVTFTSVAVTNGETYTVSFWHQGYYSVNLDFGNSVLNYRFGTNTTVGSDGWALFTETFVASGTTFTIYLYDHIYDAVQLEQKAYATPYCDGSLGTGHTWTVPASPHASTSSRSTASTVYDDIGIANGSPFTVMFWLHQFSASGKSTQWIIYVDGLSGSWIINSTTVLEIYDTDAATYRQLAAAIPQNEWAHVALVSDGATLTPYINGAAGAYPRSLAIGIETLYLRNTASGDQFQANYVIDEFVVLSRAADANEIRSIYESNAPVFAQSSITAWRSPSQVPVWVDSEGLWMRAVGGGETLGAYGGDATKSWGGKTLYQSDFLLGNATNGYIHWHAYQDTADPYGAAGMEIRARVDVLGESQFIGAVTLGASGGIYQGTGTFASPTTGLKIWSDSSVGRIAGYNAGTIQWYAGTDGRLYAGAGNIWVDSEGLWMRSVGGGETLGAYGGDATKSWGGKTLYQSDFLLGNATDGYIHWHAYQDDADPWGAAGMEVKAQVDITGSSSISGVLNVAGEFAVTNGGTLRLLVTPNTLLAGTNAGTDSSSFALVFVDDMIIGSDPGGSLYDTGDLVIGDELNSNLFWDQSAGRFNLRDGSTINSYIDEDGISLLYGVDGAHLRTMSGSTLVFDLFSETEVDKTTTFLNFYPTSEFGAGRMVIAAHNSSGVEQGRVLFAEDGGVTFSGGGTVSIAKDTFILERLDLSASTTDALVLNKLTTTQRNALSSVVDGMIFYNTTTAKVQARAAGAWVDLH